MSENGEKQAEHSEPRRPRERSPHTSRQRLYHLAEVYDRCVAARRRLDRAGRGLPPHDKADYRGVLGDGNSPGDMVQTGGNGV